MDEGRRGERVGVWAVGRERGRYGGGDGDGDGVGGASSEDVWERRRWKVRGAFEGDWGVVGGEGRERAEGEEGGR